MSRVPFWLWVSPLESQSLLNCYQLYRSSLFVVLFGHSPVFSSRSFKHTGDPNSVTLNMEAVRSPEMSDRVYYPARRNNSEDIASFFWVTSQVFQGMTVSCEKFSSFRIICAFFSSSWYVWPSKTYLGSTIFRNVGNHVKQRHVPEDLNPYFLLLNKMDIVLVTLFPYRVTIVSDLNTTMCFGYCWAAYHCQLDRSTEWWTKMLLCWIYVAGSNKRYLCYHVQCPGYFCPILSKFECFSTDFHKRHQHKISRVSVNLGHADAYE
jgi:hypothetical protein